MTEIATTDRALAHRWETPPVAGVAAFALATALGAVAVFGADQQQDQVDAYPALVVFYGVVSALVFGLVVRPAAASGASARRVLVLGGLALVSNAVFWAGLPAILGIAALAVRPHAPATRGRAVGTALAAVALAACTILAVVG